MPSEGDASRGADTAERLRRVEFMLEKIAGKVLPDADEEGSQSHASGSHKDSESDLEHMQPRESWDTDVSRHSL